MFAIELSASIFWAREMRGMLSIASTVAPLSVQVFRSSGFCAGQKKLIRVCPDRRSSTSFSSGARTFMTMSALSQRSAAEETTSHPASRYASSEKLADSPAPDSIATS